MMRSCVKYLAAILLLSTGLPAWADCGEANLEGDWTVFYRDDAFPTSVLAPGENLSVSRDRRSGAFSVTLSDPEWRGWSAEWETVCANGQTILLGAIQSRRGTTTLVIEISRVVRPADLLRNARGEVRERQINIRFPQPFAVEGLSDAIREAAEQGWLASHPGHAHGYG